MLATSTINDRICRSRMFAGPYSDYTSMGCCAKVCFHCQARFWIDEKLKRCSNSSARIYHRCCLGCQETKREESTAKEKQALEWEKKLAEKAATRVEKKTKNKLKKQQRRKLKEQHRYNKFRCIC